MTINPKKPVIRMPPCKESCYKDPCPDGGCADPDCDYCTYKNPFAPKVYKVPRATS
jgi:hypothetical protein